MDRQVSKSMQPELAQLDEPITLFGAAVTDREDDIDRWTARVSETFVPLDASPIGNGPFYGELRSLRRGPLLIAHIHGSAQEVRHGCVQIAKQQIEAVYLNLQLDGLGRVLGRQGETSTIAGAGAIVPADEIFTLQFEQPFTQLCVAMPAEWFCDRLGSPAASLQHRHISTNRGMGRLIPAAISAIIESQDEEEAILCGDLLGRALTDAMRLQQLDHIRVSQPDPLLGAIRGLILSRLAETGLTPSKAAKALGCSLSTLHLHCQRGGRSFSTMLMSARLDAAVMMLHSMKPGIGRIDAIASTCGFADPSHFTRRFKSRFGVPPSHYQRKL